jgi:hypothetical protein
MYLDSRRDVFDVAHIQVHDEAAVLREMAVRSADVFRQACPGVTDEVVMRSAAAFNRKASGELSRSMEWQYSLAVDDIIARLHERDPALPWNTGTDVQVVMRTSAELGWLTRSSHQRRKTPAPDVRERNERGCSRFCRLSSRVEDSVSLCCHGCAR